LAGLESLTNGKRSSSQTGTMPQRFDTNLSKRDAVEV
jgi:hypothetical protein